jgi:ubiquinone/menaquinone biosynthesis C-methylase UbiE
MSLADWLALREPADVAARSSALVDAVAARLPAAGTLRILDLGTGTGSNVRYIAPRLRAPQEWLIVDRDQTVLHEARERLTAVSAALDVRVDAAQRDMGRDLDASLIAGRHLVTASALLDLVSEEWLTTLARVCRQAGAAVLFALSYNGESRCTPPEPEDTVVRLLMNRHQLTDKGFGPSAGPQAAAIAARVFASHGYEVRRETTTWVLDADQAALQRQWLEGLAHAARETAPEQTALVDSWLTRRIGHLEKRRSRIRVSHEDMAGWLR